MGSLNRFFKQNKIKKENTLYAATKSLVDEHGQPLLWEIQPMTTRKNDALRDECTIDVPVTGKPGQYHQKLNTTKYIAKLIVACTVEPNLHDKDLQESYGAMSAEELIREMIDDPGEYNDFANFVQGYNGFDVKIDEKVQEVKN